MGELVRIRLPGARRQTLELNHLARMFASKLLNEATLANSAASYANDQTGLLASPKGVQLGKLVISSINSGNVQDAFVDFVPFDRPFPGGTKMTSKPSWYTPNLAETLAMVKKRFPTLFGPDDSGVPFCRQVKEQLVYNLQHAW